MSEKEDKEQLKVYVSKRTLERFKRMIAMKWQTVQKGLLSFEVEAALNQYLALANTQAQDTQTPKHEKANPIPQVYKLKEDIKKYLVDTNLYEEVPQFIPNKFLEQSLGVLRGTDGRTIYKWKKLLHQYGCIKSVDLNHWEIL